MLEPPLWSLRCSLMRKSSSTLSRSLYHIWSTRFQRDKQSPESRLLLVCKMVCITLKVEMMLTRFQPCFRVHAIFSNKEKMTHQETYAIFPSCLKRTKQEPSRNMPNTGAVLVSPVLSYSSEVFGKTRLAQRKECRKYEIHVPIVPGIMCLNGLGGMGRWGVWRKQVMFVAGRFWQDW